VRRKDGPKLYEAMQSAFCLLPLATVVEQRIFITHGGLFREHGVTLDQLRQYVFRRLLSHVEGPIMISTNRLTVTISFPFSGTRIDHVQQPPRHSQDMLEQCFEDMLWSDPRSIQG
jgi:diadenosine tetraphosphatase ApaH/serine/threonine PP2A family protein phosphatase